jgi:hypothetical protein
MLSLPKIQKVSTGVPPLSPQNSTQSRSNKNTTSPQLQRERAALRKARKQAQRERARSQPPKQERTNPPQNLKDFLEQRGALTSIGGGYSSIDGGRLTAEERELVSDALARLMMRRAGL